MRSFFFRIASLVAPILADQADIQAVKADKGQHTDSTNFRSDVSNDGFIGAADVQLVKQQQGTSLP